MVSSKGIDSGRLLALDAAVTGTPAHDLEASGAAETTVRDAGNDGPWVFPVRPQLRDALANLPEGEVSGATARWGANEDWMAVTDPEELAVLQDLVGELRGLAREAIASGRDLYLWVSL